MTDLKHYGEDILRTELDNCHRRGMTLARENMRLRTACEFVEGRLSDLPLTSRTPEERLSELEEWIHYEILPKLRAALGHSASQEGRR
jgi:hypothetical protein